MSQAQLEQGAERLLRAASHERERALRRVERVSVGLRGAWRRAERGATRVEELRDRLSRLARRRLELAQREVERALSALAVGPRRRLLEGAAAQGAIATRLAQSGRRRLQAEERRLLALERLCRELDPARVLVRGFSITRDAAGRVVRRPTDVAVGELVRTELAGGRLASRVEETS
jgi:exodeoxyribonuclease VII large subunit